MGINLLPSKGKICNFDCIYCECGWNKDGLSDTTLPTAADVHNALQAKLIECSKEAQQIDSITFSGDGEPTLNPEFPEIIRDTLALRNQYYPKAKVSVLSNATNIAKDSVFEALKLVDNPILKLDAPTNELVAIINQPQGAYSVEKTVEALSRFKGNFVLQTMFLRSQNFDSASPQVLKPWMDIVRYLKPREVMVYTLNRPAPAAGLQKYSAEQMRTLVQPLINEGFNIQLKG